MICVYRRSSRHSLVLIVVLMSRKVVRKKLNINLNAASSALAGMEVQLEQKAWDATTTSCLGGPLQVVQEPFM